MSFTLFEELSLLLIVFSQLFWGIFGAINNYRIQRQIERNDQQRLLEIIEEEREEEANLEAQLRRTEINNQRRARLFETRTERLEREERAREHQINQNQINSILNTNNNEEEQPLLNNNDNDNDNNE